MLYDTVTQGNTWKKKRWAPQLRITTCAPEEAAGQRYTWGVFSDSTIIVRLLFIWHLIPCMSRYHGLLGKLRSVHPSSWVLIEDRSLSMFVGRSMAHQINYVK